MRGGGRVHLEPPAVVLVVVKVVVVGHPGEGVERFFPKRASRAPVNLVPVVVRIVDVVVVVVEVHGLAPGGAPAVANGVAHGSSLRALHDLVVGDEVGGVGRRRLARLAAGSLVRRRARAVDIAGVHALVADVHVGVQVLGRRGARDHAVSAPRADATGNSNSNSAPEPKSRLARAILRAGRRRARAGDVAPGFPSCAP